MYCNNCGTLNSDNATHCTNCGAQLQTEVQQPVYEAQPEVQTAPEQPVYEAQPEVQAAPAQEEAPVKDPGKGLGITSLILGIVSLTCCCGPIALISAIVGIILGSKGFNKSADAGFENKLAKIGKILSIIAIILAIVSSVLGFIFGFAGGMLGAIEDSMYYYY